MKKNEENKEIREETIEELYKKSLKYYCYLYDAVGIDSSKEIDYKKGSYKNSEKVNGKSYKDPDTHSKNLYGDMKNVYNFQASDGVKKVNNNESLEFQIECVKFNLIFNKNESKENCSTDYIGPSRTTGRDLEIPDELTGQILRICRTIGGHVFWPCKQINKCQTINQSRGNGTKCDGITDRIDCTLLELKHFLDTTSDKAICFEGLFKIFQKYEYWFRKFGERGNPETFKTFIKFMFLDNFVTGVEGEDKVINLVTNKPFEIPFERNKTLTEELKKDKKINKDEKLKISQEIYYAYARNLCDKILARTEAIDNFAKEKNIMISQNDR